MEFYGKTKSEEDLEQILQCREIVKEILNFGVNQRQILMLVQFLGQELERHEDMVAVVTLARDLLREENVLLIDKADESDGTTD